MKNNFKEPSTIFCDRTKKSKAVKRLKEMGLIFHKVLDRFFDFLIQAPETNIYGFMRKDFKKIVIGGAIVAGIIGIGFLGHQIKKHKCDDFKTQEEAQIFFETHNASYLDRDKDLIACEHLR